MKPTHQTPEGTETSLPPLGPAQRHLPRPDVRIVHLGLGAFHRAHQAWYTDRVDSARQWGIAAFTGRHPGAAETLQSQDCLYTVVERSENGEKFSLVQSIAAAFNGADLATLARLVAAPATAIITLTITEAGYHLDPAGQLDLAAAETTADATTLRQVFSGHQGQAPTGNDQQKLGLVTAPGRLVFALEARRQAGSGPVAVVSCDNLAANGTATRNAVVGMAAAVSAELADWIFSNVSFVSTSVDRITPRTTAADLAVVAEACGYRDAAPVITEPFHNWILSGDFPAGRPRWEDAGAVFVDDIEPYENRKLWLLNGAHSILAYAGQLRGHATVAEALSDDVCSDAVEAFWDEAASHLHGDDLAIPEYRAALLERFGNARIAHHLTQIAMDGTTKLRMRALPVLAAERAAGRSGDGAARMIAAWIAYLSSTADFQDPLSADILAAKTLDGEHRTAALLALLSPGLAQDMAVVSRIHRLQGSIATAPTHV